MFETVIAADIGSAYTKLATAKKISRNETRAALDPKDTRRVLAFGEAAKQVLNAAEVFPVRGGISDIGLTALMLRRFALDLLGRRSLFGMSLLIALPAGRKRIDIDGAQEAGREAGFRRVGIVDSLLAGAVGAGVDIGARTASMVVDIGRESLDTLVCANGGIIRETSSPFGSSIVDKRILAYFAEEEGVLLSSRTAEKLKKSLGSPMLRIGGRDSYSGTSCFREIRPSVLKEAVSPAIGIMITEIASVIDSIPPEPAADLIENGITLIGGGALQSGLRESMEQSLGVPVRVAGNAESAVIFGMQLALRRETTEDLEAATAKYGA